ncbi:MAG: outer membrane beta-barrel protein [Deltaproteobacteria bacterium]|nr:outer membrane beta-barrel protein [Deltaproteobacteria bacterium]
MTLSSTKKLHLGVSYSDFLPTEAPSQKAGAFTRDAFQRPAKTQNEEDDKHKFERCDKNAAIQSGKKPFSDRFCQFAAPISFGFYNEGLATVDLDNPGSEDHALRSLTARDGVSIPTSQLSLAREAEPNSVGFGFDLMAGNDAENLKPGDPLLNMPYAYMRQAYFSFLLQGNPKNGTFYGKIGLFDTDVGIESNTNTLNPFYSRSLQWMTDPVNHSLFRGAWTHANEQFSVLFGLNNTWNPSLKPYITSRLGLSPLNFGGTLGISASFLDGALTYSAIFMAGSNNFEDPSTCNGEAEESSGSGCQEKPYAMTFYHLASTYSPVEKPWAFAVELDHGRQRQPDAPTGRWYTASAYFRYFDNKVTNLETALRFTVLVDPDTFITGQHQTITSGTVALHWSWLNFIMKHTSKATLFDGNGENGESGWKSSIGTELRVDGANGRVSDTECPLGGPHCQILPTLTGGLRVFYEF